MNGNPKKKKKKKKKKKNYWPGGPVENKLLWPELARPPKTCVRASGHIANVKPCRCSANIYPAAKKYPPPVTLPSVLSAVCIAQN